MLQESKSSADTATSAEILRLQQQNALLTRLLESEQQKTERLKEELIKNISGLLGEFIAKQDHSRREAFSEMAESNNTAEQEMTQLMQEQGQRLENAIARGRQWSVDLERRGAEGKRTRDGGIKVALHHTLFI